MLTATPAILAVLEPAPLYGLGMRAVALDIGHSDLVANLNRGPLHVSQEDVDRILYSTFDTADITVKAKEVHAGLVRFIVGYPEARTFRISIETERPVLADSLGRLMEGQYASLPECGFGDDVSTLLSAAGLKLFGGSSEEFFHEDHPDCRPPEVIASRVQEAIQEEFETMAIAGSDSVDAFPDDPDDPGFASLMAQINRWLAATWVGWPLIFLAAAAIIALLVAPRGVRWMFFSVFGVGMVLYGAAAIILAPPRIAHRFGSAGTAGEASEVWAALGSYAFQRTTVVSGTWALAIGLVLCCGFGLATVAVWRARCREDGHGQ